jgi:hypothetical protein
MTTDQAQAMQPAAGPEPIDPALLRAIRPSAARMAAAEDSFVGLLHEDIGTFVPHLPDGGWRLCERIARTVLWLTLSDQPADAAVQTAIWLGAANQTDGFPLSEYVTVGHALVRIAREMCDTTWSTTTGSAWIRFFIWLHPHLLAGAAKQPAHQSATHQQAVRSQPTYTPATSQPATRPEAVAEQSAPRDGAVTESPDGLPGDQKSPDLPDG